MYNSRIPDPLVAEWLRSPAQIMPWLAAMPRPGMSAQSLPREAARPDVSFLFRMCLNPVQGLDAASYQAAANRLGTDVATIQTVATVETSGKAFDDFGRPRILFERHYFHRLTHGRFDKLHPDISSATPGGYGKFSAQYGKLEKAYGLAAEAALQSASWGRFQIMGANFAAAGYACVQALVLALTRSEAAHLSAFATFVASDKTMLAALKKRDWAGFAKAYNGPGYKANDYDGKLQKAYHALTSRR